MRFTAHGLVANLPFQFVFSGLSRGGISIIHQIERSLDDSRPGSDHRRLFSPLVDLANSAGFGVEWRFSREAPRPTLTLGLRGGASVIHRSTRLATSGGGTNPRSRAWPRARELSDRLHWLRGRAPAPAAGIAASRRDRDHASPRAGSSRRSIRTTGQARPAVPRPGRPPSESRSSERGGLAAWFEVAGPVSPPLVQDDGHGRQENKLLD